MESGTNCKTALKWLGFHVLLFNLIFLFGLMFADVDITLKKLLIEQIHGHSLKKLTAFIMKKNVLGSFSLLQTLPGNIILRIMINVIFDFQVILFFPTIAQS